MSNDAHTSQATDPIDVTRDLLLKHDKPGPRYTSYPTAPEWNPDFGPSEYRAALARAAQRTEEPLSLYFHLPFCWQRCLFCGCNVVISKRHEISDTYLGYLYREMEMVAEALGDRRKVTQVHWGGGTPTYLDVGQISDLASRIRKTFEVTGDAEVAIEVDPRVTTREQLVVLRDHGFNRISMGVQDLDPKVQAAITRNQTEEETRRLFDQCRELGFEGINIDLIYGLPEQTMEGWSRTVDSIIDIRPDRLAVYSYAHLPKMIKHQAKLEHYPRPQGPEKYDLFAEARRRFLAGGYLAIGMDHFALPEDELSVALHERRLHRNFMGYTVVPAADMVGLGVSAIGEIGGVYAQNEKRPVKYEQALDAGELPTMTGIVLSRDDEIRRWVIRQLMCNFHLEFADLKQHYGVDYDAYFAEEESGLVASYNEGLLVREEAGLRVLPLGEAFIRNICMVFDRYLQKPEGHRQFSRTV